MLQRRRLCALICRRAVNRNVGYEATPETAGRIMSLLSCVDRVTDEEKKKAELPIVVFFATRA